VTSDGAIFFSLGCNKTTNNNTNLNTFFQGHACSTVCAVIPSGFTAEDLTTSVAVDTIIQTQL